MKNPPDGYQGIIPYLLYKDANAALVFLDKAFGLKEKMRMTGEGGEIMHAEAELNGNVVMLASVSAAQRQSDDADMPGQASMMVCYVDDVDAHFERAKAAGAEIIKEPEDQFYGDRTYGARDPEGHAWNFHTHVRDVAPEDMQPPTG